MNTKCTKLSAILLFAAGGLSTVSAQTTPVVYQKLGENPFTLESTAALQIDSKNRGFLLPRVDPASITGAVHGLIILNDAPVDSSKPKGDRKFQGANQLQINIGDGTKANWVGFASSSPTIVNKLAISYALLPDDSTVLFDLTEAADKANVDVTLPAVTADNSGKIYVINRLDNYGDKTLTFKIAGLGSTDADTKKNGLVLSTTADVLKTLNYAKKITVQANFSTTPAVATWNIINMN